MEPEGSLPHSQVLSTCPYPEPDQSSPHHPILSVFVLSTHLRLGLPSGFFASGFPANNLYAFLFSPIRATCSAHPILLDLIILIILDQEYKSRNSSLCSFLYRPVTSSHFGPNILLSTLFLNILSLCSNSLIVKVQLQKKKKTSGREPQGAWSQVELTEDKLPDVK
jgi:hypothetical protein